jgi:hypothetical protein
MTVPRLVHYAAILRILRYVKGTLFHGLHFSSHSSLDLHVYSNADWAGDPIDSRSTTGYCFLLGDSLISWRSKKQSVVAHSSTEAEYRALVDTTFELLWLLQDMGATQTSSSPILCDSRSAIQIAHNDVFHERTKHIEIDCHFVHHHLSQGTLYLCPILLLLISWLMCSPKHIHLDVSVILFPNSSWLPPYHLEFEGGC